MRDETRRLRIVRSIGNTRSEVEISPARARELGIGTSGRGRPSVAYLMDGLVSWQQTEPAKQTTCPQCGTSHREIVLRETAGCELCFEVFSASIERILGNRRVRGFHSGRIPKRLQRYRRMFVEREDLIARLNVALDSEDFERAAELRDRIQSMSADESASE